MLTGWAYFALFAQCLIGGVLLVSGGAKLRDPGGFAVSLRDLRLACGQFCRPVAIAVIATEFAVAGLVVSPWTATAGLGTAAGLLLVFAAVAFRAGGRSVPCRCFGAQGAPLGARHGVRNLVLSVISAVGAILHDSHPFAPLGVATTVLAGLVGIIFIVFLDDLVDLFTTERRIPRDGLRSVRARPADRLGAVRPHRELRGHPAAKRSRPAPDRP